MTTSQETGLDLSNPAPPKLLPTVDHPTNRPNFCTVIADDTAYWFSYKTCIAFQRRWESVVCRENVWGPTTGKHMHYIGVPKEERIPGELFEELLYS
jgi:hypothetical protein